MIQGFLSNLSFFLFIFFQKTFIKAFLLSSHNAYLVEMRGVEPLSIIHSK